MLLQSLFTYDLLCSRVKTHTSVFSKHTCLRVFLLELFDSLVAVPDLRIRHSVNAPFLNQLAFRVVGVFLFHPEQVFLVLLLVVVRIYSVWRVWGLGQLALRTLSV